ncbi:hypothetical protein ACIP5N_21260 [Streptomyces sp. NPDC088768]|uniref:hypothetical protein n=1 Tax=Streptomyces sp. NPDC088768 TaxID=3365894 RepID=UPI00381B5011
MAPLVEEVTGLTRPDTVVIETVLWTDWIEQMRRVDRDRYHADTAELQPDWANKAAARITIFNASRARKSRSNIPAQTIPLGTARSKILLMPEVLREAGRLDDDQYLHCAIAHELVHAFQYTAADDLADLGATAYQDLRGVADRDYMFLVEGHAYWADRQIARTLYGAPLADGPGPGATKEFVALTKTARYSDSKADKERAITSVGDIIDRLGATAFNQIWTRPDLVPLQSETDEPDLWAKRVEASTSA